MRSLDEIVGDKILSLINYGLSKIIKPDLAVDKVSQLNGQEIERIKQEYGVEGIILDVDDTLRRNMNKIPKCNQDWIDSLRGRIKIIVLSNGIDKGIEKYFNDKGIDYIGFAFKPLRKNFLKACEKMQLNPEKVLVVGNDLISDVYGGQRNRMKTILIRKVEDNER